MRIWMMSPSRLKSTVPVSAVWCRYSPVVAACGRAGCRCCGFELWCHRCGCPDPPQLQRRGNGPEAVRAAQIFLCVCQVVFSFHIEQRPASVKTKCKETICKYSMRETDSCSVFSCYGVFVTEMPHEFRAEPPEWNESIVTGKRKARTFTEYVWSQK